MAGNFDVARLTAGDIVFARQALDLFGAVFGDREGYCEDQPDDAWLADLLDSRDFAMIVA